MALLQLVLLILATVCICIQAQGKQSAFNQSINQSASVESITLIKELESEAVDELTSTINEYTSTDISLVKSGQARMAKAKAAMAGVKAELTSEMTIKAIVRELKAELNKDHSIAVSELKVMLRKQEEKIEDLASDMRALREGLSYRLENSERKIEWAITDGSLAPRNTSWVMESFSRLEQRFDDMDRQLNQSLEDLGHIRKITKFISYHYADCAEIFHVGKRTSGIYTIYPQGGAGVKVYCDMVTDGGGWTVFQKRYSGEVDFFRGWEEFALGFGDPEEEYWLGLRHIHTFTLAQATELYVQLTDFDVGVVYAKYGIFKVSSETRKFQLTVGLYSGNAGDSLEFHNGQKFSTKDQDNDPTVDDCCNRWHGAWWHYRCLRSNLNGRFPARKVYNGTFMVWNHLHFSLQSMKASVMMMRPTSFKP